MRYEKVRRIIKPSLVAMIFFTTGMAAQAEPYSATIAGHSVQVVNANFQDNLKVDQKSLLSEEIITIDEIATVGGTQIVIGEASDGGNACGSAPFVISFPEGRAPRFDGPLDTCDAVSHATGKAQILFYSEPLAGMDGDVWYWRPNQGFKSGGKRAFKPNPKLSWDDLRARGAHHPSDLMNYSDISKQIYSLMGSDAKDVLPLINGVGSGAFQGDLFVGTGCRPHACPDANLLVIADVPSKKVFMAWKIDSGPLSIRPSFKNWPSAERDVLKNWWPAKSATPQAAR